MYKCLSLTDRYLQRLLIVAAALLLIPAPASASLIGHYKMDQPTWSGNNSITDYSGNGNHGTPLNGTSSPSQTTSGRLCNASNHANDNLVWLNYHSDSIAIFNNLDVDANIGNRGSIALWYQYRSGGGSTDREIFDATGLSGWFIFWTYYQFDLQRLSNGAIQFTLDDSRNRQQRVVSSSNVATDNTWVHITVTWDLPNQRVRLYINGSLVDTEGGMDSSMGTFNVLTFGDSNSVIELFGSNDGPGRSAHGYLDDIRVYNHELTSGEITTIYGLENPCASLSGCNGYYNAALQNHGSSNSISFGYNAHVKENPTSVLATANSISKNGGSSTSTCEFFDCTNSGSAASSFTLQSFQTTSASDTVSVASSGSATVGADSTTEFLSVTSNYQSTLTFSNTQSTYKIKTLSLGNQSTNYFAPGDYWIENLSISSQARVETTGSGSVRLHVLNNFSVGSSARLNPPGSGVVGDPEDLVIIARGTVTTNSSSDVNAILYGASTFTGGSSATWVGAILAGNISFNSSSQVYFDYAGIKNADFNEACTGGPTPTIDHFLISHDGSGYFCAAESITVTARDSGSSTITDFTQGITLDTQTGKGTWSLTTGNGSFSDATANDGQATYTFADSDNGVAVFSLDYQEGTIPIDVDAYLTSNSSTRDNDSEGNLTFAASGFSLTATEITDPTSFTSYATTLTAGTSQTLHLTAYGTTATDTECGIIESYTGSKTLNFWFSYVDPTGSDAPTINGTDAGINLGVAPNESVTFTSGKASVSLEYADVGQIRVYVADTSPDPDMTGNTNDFVVEPADLQFTVTDNPGATTVLGNAFKFAGQQFDVVVTGVNSDGDPTPSFGSENTVLLNKGINTTVSATLVAPAAGNSGTFTDVTGFSNNGSAAITGGFKWSEVGAIRLSASLSNYLGGGGSVTSSSPIVIGRFVPRYFDITSTSVTQGCSSGGYSYMGQNFSAAATVTAKNADGAATTNYRTVGSFATLNLSNVASYDVSAVNDVGGSPTVLTSRINKDSATSSNWVDGVATVTLNASMDKASSPDGPYTSLSLGLNLSETHNSLLTDLISSAKNLDIDNDGGSDVASLGSGVFRHGRLYMGNVSGSEHYPLTMALEAQYWNGSAFQRNTLDSCSTMTPTLTYGSPLNSGDLETDCFDEDGKDVLSSGATTILLEKPIALCTTTETGPGVRGTVSVEATSHSWLQYNFHGSGNAHAKATATFGIFEGRDPVIIIQDSYR